MALTSIRAIALLGLLDTPRSHLHFVADIVIAKGFRLGFPEGLPVGMPRLPNRIGDHLLH